MLFAGEVDLNRLAVAELGHTDTGVVVAPPYPIAPYLDTRLTEREGASQHMRIVLSSGSRALSGLCFPSGKK